MKTVKAIFNFDDAELGIVKRGETKDVSVKTAQRLLNDCCVVVVASKPAPAKKAAPKKQPAKAKAVKPKADKK